MSAHISVVIPVGPLPHHRAWITETLESLQAQTRRPDKVILVHDGCETVDLIDGLSYKLVWNEMRLGMVASFNRGVAMAQELAITLGSDDKLLPHAIEDALRTWDKVQIANAYYYFDVVYSDDGRTQSVPCHAAMVHASWYRAIGGLPPESAVGAPDTIFISMMLAKRIEASIVRIQSHTPPYWYRVHEHTDTRKRGDQRLQTAISLVRDYLSECGSPL